MLLCVVGTCIISSEWLDDNLLYWGMPFMTYSFKEIHLEPVQEVIDAHRGTPCPAQPPQQF